MSAKVKRSVELIAFLLAGSFVTPPAAQESIDFGNDAHPYAHNGVCSDARFRGAKALGNNGNRNESHQDATDCRTLFEAGEIECFSQKRCADPSRETEFRNLDVRRSILADLSEGLAPNDRAMIYVEPQQTRGETEIVSINGESFRNKQIVLTAPGTHRFGIHWLSRPAAFDADASAVIPMGNGRTSRSGVRQGSTDMVNRAVMLAVRVEGEHEFEVTLEAGRTYRVYPARVTIRDPDHSAEAIRSLNGVPRQQEGFAEVLRVWIVDVDSEEIVIDQRAGAGANQAAPPNSLDL